MTSESAANICRILLLLLTLGACAFFAGELDSACERISSDRTAQGAGL